MPESVATSRRFAVALASDSGHPVDLYDLALVTSELVTNALQACVASPDDRPCLAVDDQPVALSVCMTELWTHLAVRDPHPGSPLRRDPDRQEVRGRGGISWRRSPPTCGSSTATTTSSCTP